MSETRVLRNWQPVGFNFSDESDRNQHLLGQLFKEIIKSLRYDIVIQSVHSPGDEWKGVFEWHQDCNGCNASFVTWSNVGPTEIRFVDSGEILPVSDGDILLIDNLEVEHRTRTPVSKGRWLVRSDYLSNWNKHHEC